MPGIGGTGVVTVSQLLGAAAKIDGLPARAVDQTGLSQKAGPVVSTTTIGEARPGTVDVLLGFDLLTSVTPANLAGLDPTASVVIASTTLTPTGRMVGKPDTSAIALLPYLAELDERSRAGLNRYVDACALTTGLLGSAVTANVFLLGVAFQAGAVPLSAAAIERAIELNGAAVEANLSAFAWGRRWVVDPAGVEAAAGQTDEAPPDTTGLDDLAGDAELVRMVAIRRAELTEYQDARAAGRYLEVVRRCRQAEQAAGGDGAFTRTVAHQLHRLMAYKDEYEVARLLLAGGPRPRARRRAGREGHVEPASAGTARPRPGTQAEARPLEPADAGGAAVHEARPGDGPRSVRPQRGPSDGAQADHRVPRARRSPAARAGRPTRRSAPASRGWSTWSGATSR